MTSLTRLFTLLLSLAVLLSPFAFAQEEGAGNMTTASEEVIEAPEGSVLINPEGSEFRLPTRSLTFSINVPEIGPGINLIPQGSFVVILNEGGTYTGLFVPAKQFLMPEPMYDRARLKARQFEVCQPALEAITEETLAMADRTNQILAACGGQFDSDEEQISGLVDELRSMETRALVAEDRLKAARRNSGIAWGITGGVTLGVILAIVLSLAG